MFGSFVFKVSEHCVSIFEPVPIRQCWVSFVVARAASVEKRRRTALAGCSALCLILHSRLDFIYVFAVFPWPRVRYFYGLGGSRPTEFVLNAKLIIQCIFVVEFLHLLFWRSFAAVSYLPSKSIKTNLTTATYLQLYTFHRHNGK